MKIRNVNPLGQVDLPAVYLKDRQVFLNRSGDNGEYAEPDDNGYQERTAVHGSGCLEPGEVFEVPDDVAAHLLEQVGNFEAVDPPTDPPPSDPPAPDAPVENDEATS